MNKQFKIEKKDGKFIVMVTEPIIKPFWKFWGPSTVTSIAKKKNGDECIYDKESSAKGCIGIFTM